MIAATNVPTVYCSEGEPTDEPGYMGEGSMRIEISQCQLNPTFWHCLWISSGRTWNCIWLESIILCLLCSFVIIRYVPGVVCQFNKISPSISYITYLFDSFSESFVQLPQSPQQSQYGMATGVLCGLFSLADGGSYVGSRALLRNARFATKYMLSRLGWIAYSGLI